MTLEELLPELDKLSRTDKFRAVQVLVKQLAIDENLMLAEGEKIIYQCPMHPEEKSDKPATCPQCGMDLEKVVVKDTVKVK